MMHSLFVGQGHIQPVGGSVACVSEMFVLVCARKTARTHPGRPSPSMMTFFFSYERRVTGEVLVPLLVIWMFVVGL
jgi:hypothetical protein